MTLKPSVKIRLSEGNTLEYPLSSNNFNFLSGEKSLSFFKTSSYKPDKFENNNYVVSFLPKEIIPYTVKKLTGHRFANVVLASNPSDFPNSAAAKYANLLEIFFDCLGILDSPTASNLVTNAGAKIESKIKDAFNEEYNENYSDVDFMSKDETKPTAYNYFCPEYQKEINYPEDVKQFFKNKEDLFWFGGIPDGVSLAGTSNSVNIPNLDLKKLILEIKTYSGPKFEWKRNNNVDSIELQVSNDGMPVVKIGSSPTENDSKFFPNGNFKCPDDYLLQAALYTILSGSKNNKFILGFTRLNHEDYVKPENYDPIKHDIFFKEVKFDRKVILKYMSQAADFYKKHVLKGFSPNVVKHYKWFDENFLFIIKRNEYLQILENLIQNNEIKLNIQEIEELKKVLDFNSVKYDYRENNLSPVLINNIFENFENNFKKITNLDIVQLHQNFLYNLEQQQIKVLEEVKAYNEQNKKSKNNVCIK